MDRPARTGGYRGAVPPLVAVVLRDVLLGVTVGVFSGLLGVGGGVILVPVLVLVMHVAQKRAQATSLVMVMMAGLVGGLTYALSGEVAWIPAGLLMTGGVLGTLLGTRIMQRTPDQRLQLLFALLMLAVAALLFVQSTGSNEGAVPQVTAALGAGLVLAGFAMGMLSSLLGVGGGVIIVPILAMIFGFTQHTAEGTSLVVMVPIALVGAIRLSRAGHTDWPQGLRVGAGAMGGAVLGGTLALMLSGSVLQVLFAGLLVASAVQMLAKARTTAVSAHTAPAVTADSADPVRSADIAETADTVQSADTAETALTVQSVVDEDIH